MEDVAAKSGQVLADFQVQLHKAQLFVVVGGMPQLRLLVLEGKNGVYQSFFMIVLGLPWTFELFKLWLFDLLTFNIRTFYTLKYFEIYSK